MTHLHPTLAVDSGQTGIKVRCLGGVPYEHTFPGAVTSTTLLPQIADVVLAASRASGSKFPLVTVGTTGLTATEDDPDRLLELCAGAGTVEVRLAHDSITSFLGALGVREGVVVAAGTGVVTLGVGATAMSRVDGWGNLIGDAGSGYWIGREALDHVLRAHDGRGPATALSEVVSRLFPKLEQAYIELQTNPDRVRVVASLTRAVSDLASTDPVAADICARAGAELAHSAVAAARNVGLDREPETVVCLIGGVFGSAAVREACEAALRRELPGYRSVPPLGDGLSGAEALAELGPDHPMSAQVAIARRTACLFRVEPPLRDYAWGSPVAIPDLLGTESDGRPQAELWLGAHPGDPALLESGEGLDALLAREPQLLGGAGDHGELPFLMKLLAAGQPLSLQVHPDREQAATGHAREDAAGVPLDDPGRSYKDTRHKPEIILAISPFAALCGFRAPSDARAELLQLLGDQAGHGIGAELVEALADPEPGTALSRTLQLILSGRPEVRELARTAVARAADAAGPLADTVRLVGASYGDDPGVLATALLNRVDLAPGEALYLDAGNIHAYLHGIGIEAMAASDNVLRGGLTPKHIDVPGLLEIVKFSPIEPIRVPVLGSVADGVRLDTYRPPAEEFSVHVINADGGPRRLDDLTGPALLLVTSGTLEVSSGPDSLSVARGEAAFKAAGEPLVVCSVGGPATGYLTTVGD